MMKLGSLFLATRSRGVGRYLLARRAAGWWGVLAAAILPPVWRFARRRYAMRARAPAPALGDRGSGALEARGHA